jgi:hypothetical protein
MVRLKHRPALAYEANARGATSDERDLASERHVVPLKRVGWKPRACTGGKRNPERALRLRGGCTWLAWRDGPGQSRVSFFFYKIAKSY